MSVTRALRARHAPPGAGRAAHLVLLAVVFCIAGAPGWAGAADTLAVGTTTGRAGWTVRVPITLADEWGTPLGEENAAPGRARAFSLHLAAEPAAAVASVSVAPAGILLERDPLLEQGYSAGAAGALATVVPQDNGYWYSPPAPAVVAEAVVTLSSSAVPGTTVALSLLPATTLISNEEGTLAETVALGTLALSTGGVAILPAIYLEILDGRAAEGGRNYGRFRISRTGDPAAPLTVYVAYLGSAKSRVDYRPLPEIVTIPAGSSSVTLVVRPRDDRKRERTEKVLVLLLRSDDYVLDVPNVGGIAIRDND